MSSLQQRIPSVAHMRLAAIAAATANLKAQLSELERLREQVRKAQLSV
jgi:HAMP domain-containing protein